VKRQRDARAEVDIARGILESAQETIRDIDQRWAKSKRGSNAQRSFDRLQEQIGAALECCNDALADFERTEASNAYDRP
jgi:hypothetical protein